MLSAFEFINQFVSRARSETRHDTEALNLLESIHDNDTGEHRLGTVSISK